MRNAIHQSDTEHPCHGFTLIELLAGITIAAILLGIGIPSFTTMINNNRLAADSNELVTSLTLARSEAIKRGHDISVCPRASETACAADSLDWSNGWLVFDDDTGTKGSLDVDDTLLQSSAGGDSGIAILGDVASVTYLPNGVRARAALTVSKSGCKGKNKREIKVELTGRIALNKVNC